MKKLVKRDNSIDFLKGIAIILVVLGHAIQYGSGDEFYYEALYFDDVLFQFIYSFHMPLFALVSGYLFFWSMRKSTGELIKRQFFLLVIPIVIWEVFGTIAFDGKKLLYGEIRLGDLCKEYINRLPYAFWFLWAIFFVSIIVIAVEKWAKGNFLLYFLFLGVMLFVPSKMNAHMYIFIYPYFVIGYLFHKNEKRFQKFFEKTRWIVASSIVVFCILFLFYDRNTFIYTTKISLLETENIISQLKNDILRWTIGLIGSVMMISFFNMLYDMFQNSWIVRATIELGRISLGIYILNTYSNQLILRRVTDGLSPGLLLWIVETLISLLIYYAILWVIKKNSIANKVLFGGR